MQFDEIVFLRDHHPAWSVLRSNNVALVLSFLERVYIEANVADLPASHLIDELDEELYALNQRLGEGTFPRTPQAYLEEWASSEKSWLRKFYPAGSDEPHFDLSPAIEKAILWVHDLRAREFVGTESRLNTAFELLRQMIFGADEDPASRLAELQRRRNEIDAEIERVERGEITVLDTVSQRDRYQQFIRTARELLSDFREVEDNFRRLDRNLREQIATWAGSKGEFLDSALGSANSIAESDQGRSFSAFCDFLLSHQRQTEFTELLHRLQEIDALGKIDQRIERVHFDWIDAAERTQATVRLLSEQLRRFLDDQVWLENRRVFELLRSIEASALELRDQSPDVTMHVDATSVNVKLPFERPLHRVPMVIALDSSGVENAADETDAGALLNQLYIDRELLASNVRSAMHERSQVGLTEVISESPLTQGLAELIGYLSLGDRRFATVFDDERRESVEWATDEASRVADIPQVTFDRRTTR